MKLSTRVGNPGKGNWALAVKLGDGEYEIITHKTLDGLPLALAVFHEFLHVWCWEYCPFLSLSMEHKFIAANERSLKRHWKKYWRGA